MSLEHFNLQYTDHLKDAIPLECLGQGTFGTIRLYQCKQVSNCRVCDKYFIVKKIKYKTRFAGLHRFIRQCDVEKFYEEFRIGFMLDHPNIRKTFDIDTNLKSIVFENCRGIDLLDYLNFYKPKDTRRLVALYNQILDAVCYLHDNAIAHLDLKLENIILNTDTNIIKLIDFGEAVQYIKIKSKDKQDNGDLDGQNTSYIYEEVTFIGARGTVQYICPEQANLEYFSAPLADIWSCGIILYNLLYNRTPWEIADEQIDWRYKLHDIYLFKNILNISIFKQLPEHFTTTEWKILQNIFKISLHPMPEKRRSIHFIKSVFNLIKFN
jgi:serine/threonine protein kinase